MRIIAHGTQMEICAKLILCTYRLRHKILSGSVARLKEFLQKSETCNIIRVKSITRKISILFLFGWSEIEKGPNFSPRLEAQHRENIK